MTNSLYVLIPADKNPKIPPPDIASQYEDLLVVANIDRVHRDWIEVLSHAHELQANPSASQYSAPEIGDLSLSIFKDENTPILAGLLLGQETLPYIVFRIFETYDGKIECQELLFEHARIKRLATSGSQGGRAIQSMTITGLILSLRVFIFNSEGQILSDNSCRYDRIKDVTERTRKSTYVKSLLDIAHENINTNNLSNTEKEHLESLDKNKEYSYAKKESNTTNSNNENTKDNTVHNIRPVAIYRRK